MPCTTAGGPPIVTHVLFETAGASATMQSNNSSFTVSAGSNTPPFGWLDYAKNAADGTTTVPPGGTLSLAGWSADQQDGSPVSKVQLAIDGAVIGNAVLGDSRPDVATAYNDSRFTQSGWHLDYVVPGTLAGGPHTVTAVAFDSAGATATMRSNNSSFTVSGGASIKSLKHIIFM